MPVHMPTGSRARSTQSQLSRSLLHAGKKLWHVQQTRCCPQQAHFGMVQQLCSSAQTDLIDRQPSRTDPGVARVSCRGNNLEQGASHLSIGQKSHLHAPEAVDASCSSAGDCDGVRVVASWNELHIEDLTTAPILLDPAKPSDFKSLITIIIIIITDLRT